MIVTGPSNSFSLWAHSEETQVVHDFTLQTVLKCINIWDYEEARNEPKMYLLRKES